MAGCIGDLGKSGAGGDLLFRVESLLDPDAGDVLFRRDDDADGDEPTEPKLGGYEWIPSE